MPSFITYFSVFPNYSKQFILDTDASLSGIGAVLSQCHKDGCDCVIAYASRSLSRQEQQYCVTRRELLAVVEFVHHFRHYLLGKEFILRTDHGSLTWIQNFREPEGQLARWLDRLQEYDFIVQHRPGAQHGNADALSRIPSRQCGSKSHNSSEAVPTQVGLVWPLIFQVLSPKKMSDLQMAEPSMGPVMRAVISKQKPLPEEIKTWGQESRRLLQYWDLLIIKDGQQFMAFNRSRTIMY